MNVFRMFFHCFSKIAALKVIWPYIPTKKKLLDHRHWQSSRTPQLSVNAVYAEYYLVLENIKNTEYFNNMFWTFQNIYRISGINCDRFIHSDQRMLNFALSSFISSNSMKSNLIIKLRIEKTPPKYIQKVLYKQFKKFLFINHTKSFIYKPFKFFRTLNPLNIQKVA